MFDLILAKIQQKTAFAVESGIMNSNEESVIASFAPKSYDGAICESELKIVCIGKTYERALENFNSVTDGLYELTQETGEILKMALKDAVMRYDTASGMTRIIGKFEVVAEGLEQ